MTRSYQQIVDEVTAKVVKDWMITFPCAACPEPVIIKPNSEEHMTLKWYAKNYLFKHTKCFFSGR